MGETFPAPPAGSAVARSGRNYKHLRWSTHLFAQSNTIVSGSLLFIRYICKVEEAIREKQGLGEVSDNRSLSPSSAKTGVKVNFLPMHFLLPQTLGTPAFLIPISLIVLLL